MVVKYGKQVKLGLYDTLSKDIGFGKGGRVEINVFPQIKVRNELGSVGKVVI